MYDTIVAGICEGETYNFNGAIYAHNTIVSDTFVNDNGCDSIVTLSLTVHPNPQISLSHLSVDEICIGDTITLYANGTSYFIFYDTYNDQIASAPGSDTVSIRIPAARSNYYDIGTDDNGCFMKSGIEILANNCCEIVIPNAFSPNSDGLNDYFGALSTGNPQDYQLRIFNRWGETVFVSYIITDKWDGTFNGKPCDMGTYYYQIQVNCHYGSTSSSKGEVHLIR